ncbi:hypothetical protein Q7C36_008192 [Tachysurus vachellii]|uniref:Uncharacterized protein n=1 Tax=Tachysurus vachellii TaxID=175792 RepID=A0AA88T075_TACVA|nr:hypothetical protein Q7C36_008192 [Tachysurus vachellii]
MLSGCAQRAVEGVMAGPALYMATVMQGKHQGWRRLLRGHPSPGVKRRGSLLESARHSPLLQPWGGAGGLTDMPSVLSVFG